MVQQYIRVLKRAWGDIARTRECMIEDGINGLENLTKINPQYQLSFGGGHGYLDLIYQGGKIYTVGQDIHKIGEETELTPRNVIENLGELKLLDVVSKINEDSKITHKTPKT